MTGPSTPGGVPQDLMLPFGPLDDATGRDVILSAVHADAALAYCQTMGSKFGAPGYLRYIFGLPIDEALRSGYQITQRALRETTPHACAQEMARTALELLSDPEGGPAAAGRSALDLFAGVGQMSYSYGKAGCTVQSVEIDHPTVDVGMSNMARAGLAGAVEYHLADGPATLASAVEAGQGFSVVHLDPPWRGTYKYDLNQPFLLGDLSADVAELVRLGLESAPVVVMSLPHNASSSQIGALGTKLGCCAFVQYLYISDWPASFSQAPAYFFRSGAGRDGAAGFQERHQKLTVDGKRVT